MRKLLLTAISAVAISILLCAAQFQVGERRVSSGGGIVVHDDFNYCDVLNSNWTNISTDYPIVIGNTYCTNQSSYGVYTSNTYARIQSAYWSANPIPADQFSEATVEDLIIAGTSAWVGVTVRTQPSTTLNGYLCMVTNSGSAISSYLYRCDNESCAQIGNAGPSVSVGDVIHLSAVGTTIACKINGTLIAAAADSAYSSGKPGIAAYGIGYGGAARAGAWSGGSSSEINTIPPIILPAAAGIFPLNDNSAVGSGGGNTATVADTSGNSTPAVFAFGPSAGVPSGGACSGSFWYNDPTYGTVGCFDGANNNVYIGGTGTAIQNITYNLSLSAKINIPSGGGGIAVQLGTDTIGAGWGALLGTDGTLHPTFSIVTGGTGYGVTGTSTISTNTWHTITGVRTGGTVQIFLDDAMVGTTTAPGDPIRGAGASTAPSIIGAFRDPFSGAFLGHMRDVRFYAASLTQAQVAAIAADQGTAPPVTIPTPFALYTLCGETSSTSGCTGTASSPYYVYDTSGNNRTIQWDVANALPTFVTGTNVPYDAQFASGARIWGGSVNSSSLPPPFTICYWMNPSDISISPIPIAYLNVGNWDGWYFADSSSGLGFGSVNNGNFGAAVFVPNTVVAPAGTWTHVCGSADAAGNISLYMNGALLGTATGAPSPANTATVQISGSWNAHPFVGLMSDVRVFNSILTAPQINAIYSQKKY